MTSLSIQEFLNSLKLLLPGTSLIQHFPLHPKAIHANFFTSSSYQPQKENFHCYITTISFHLLLANSKTDARPITQVHCDTVILLILPPLLHRLTSRSVLLLLFPSIYSGCFLTLALSPTPGQWDQPLLNLTILNLHPSNDLLGREMCKFTSNA